MRKYLTSAWSLGLMIAVPVILLLPPFFQKYRVTLISNERRPGNCFDTRYYDLNGDSVPEKIVSLEENGQLAFQYFDDSGRLVNQMNFRYDFCPQVKDVFCGDRDGNGYTEVYGFTMKSDSLYLNGFEPYPDTSNNQTSRFVATIGRYNLGRFNFGILNFTIIDFDKDGNKEIVFSVEAGRSLHPRQIFIVNSEDGKVESSKDDGINAYDLAFDDLDGDGKYEIITGSSTSANLKTRQGKDTIDDRPCLRIFDDNLGYLFPPVAFPKGLMNQIRTFVAWKEEKSLVVFHFFRDAPDENPVKIYQVTVRGEKTDSLIIPCSRESFNPVVVQDSSGVFLLWLDKKVVEIEPDLSKIKIHKIRNTIGIVKEARLPDIRFPVYVCRDFHNNVLHIYNRKLTNLISFEVPEPVLTVSTETCYGPDVLMTGTASADFYYHIRKNGFYWLKFPVYLLIWILSSVFIREIQKMTEKRLRETFALQEQIRQLQVRTFTGQMDPHFMFNLFTIMASLLQKGEREEAFHAFLRFSKLVRSNLENEGRLTRTLKEELEVTGTWLELSRMRYGERMSFTVDVEQGVDDQILVPKMFLQIHAENCVKHGLALRHGNGRIRIEIKRSGEFIKAVVEDNGVGRKAAKESGLPSTKKGHRMLQAMYDRLNETNRLKIKQNITDIVTEDGEPAGTRIEMEVPLNLREPGDGLS